MAYSGKFVPVNTAKYKGDYKNIVYRSLWERDAFRWCDKTSAVLEWSSEETIIPYYYEGDKKYHRYFMDLKIKFADRTLLVEIKPANQTKPPKKPAQQNRKYITESLTFVKNMNKWEAARNFAKDRGWEFEIWTEKTLTAMGIMTKIKPMKPYPKKLKGYPKKLKPFKSKV